MKYLLTMVSVVCTVLLAIMLQQCHANRDTVIPYPKEPPEDSVVSFLPGIVCSGGDSIDFNATFSPDGRAFYFTRSQNRKWDIYISRYQDGSWTKAVKAGIGENDAYSEADPMFGPDGFLYFISDRPRNADDTLRDFDIWFARPLAENKWSSPERVDEVNSDSTEYYVSFAGNGTLYFASSRAGGFGLEDIYSSRRVNGKYTKPENLGPEINSIYSDHDPCLPINENFIIYTSVDRPDGMGEGDLYVSVKDSNGHWQKGKSMGPPFNTSTYEYCAYFTPDHQYFFFSSRRDVKWMRAADLPTQLVELIH